jgi:hypothetical protein
VGLSRLSSSGPTPPAVNTPTITQFPSPSPTTAGPSNPVALQPEAPSIHALSSYGVRVPSVGLPNYQTSGSYPQISGGGAQLATINAALRALILDDQATYRRTDRQLYGTSLDHVQAQGIYRIDFTPSLMSASTVVVSTMFPTEELYPDGNDGQGWLSFTTAVSSGRPVQLVVLLRSQSAGLQTISSYVLAHLAKDSCFRASGATAYQSETAPKAANYRQFALTPAGLDIGVGQGQTGAEACGQQRVTIPWSIMRPRLDALGLRLVDGLR